MLLHAFINWPIQLVTDELLKGLIGVERALNDEPHADARQSSLFREAMGRCSECLADGLRYGAMVFLSCSVGVIECTTDCFSGVCAKDGSSLEVWATVIAH